MRREAVVRQRFPVGEVHHQIIGKLADFIVQTQRILHIRGDKHHRTGVTFGDFCHQRRAGGTGQFDKLALVARFTR